MRGKTTRREVVASVETTVPGVDFEVTDKRTITLTFPNSVVSMVGSGRLPFNKTLTADEARAIGHELIDAADRVTAAEHVA